MPRQAAFDAALVRLPGGVVAGADGARAVRLAAPTGHLECLIDAPGAGASTPAHVTAIIGAAVVGDDGAMLGTSWSRRLSAGDRRFLLRRLLLALGRGARWRTLACDDCGCPFDVLIDHEALVPPSIPEGWPGTRARLHDGRVVAITTPSGADEEAVAGLDRIEAEQQLLVRCTDLDDEDVRALGAADRAILDEALEALGPDPILVVHTACPDCGAPAEVPVDPYAAIGTGEDRLLREVHDLASTYHWSEDAILALASSRRRAYLALVDEARGAVR